MAGASAQRTVQPSSGAVARLRRVAVGAHLACAATLARIGLRGHTGPRDFRRVIVVAALGRRNGVAAGARLQWDALRSLGIEAELLDATPALRNPFHRVEHRPGTAYVFHAGGPQTASLVCSVLPAAANAYRVAYWAWELPDPAPDWAGSDRVISEIWTPSGFSRESLSRLTVRPIHVVPHHLPPRPARPPRAGRPFTVLAMADSRSSLSRKNAAGAVRAFRAAFDDSRSARLVLKLGGRPAELDAFERDVVGPLRAGNVALLREHLDEAALDALYRSADVLLSVHRAEGFGLPLREAMSRGIPVVATGWSGNLEFMDEANSLLVPYRLVPVSDADGVYGAGTWAEPDLDAAAALLRRLAEDAGLYARLSERAYASVVETRPSFPFAVHSRRDPAYA